MSAAESVLEDILNSNSFGIQVYESFQLKNLPKKSHLEKEVLQFFREEKQALLLCTKGGFI